MKRRDIEGLTDVLYVRFEATLELTEIHFRNHGCKSLTAMRMNNSYQG